MDKNRINTLLPLAYKALSDHKIAEGGCIVKTYRGQISTFGAAINSGSLLAAIAFFSEKKDSTVDRPALLKCIKDLIIPDTEKDTYKDKNLFDYVLTQKDRESECKEDILHAAIALKLAMNLYVLTKDKKSANVEEHNGSEMS